MKKPLASGPLRRWHWALMLGLLLAALMGLAAHLAARALHAAVLQALGPQAQLARLELGWRSVELHGLVLKAARGTAWPDTDEARANLVHIVPAWRSFWPGQPWRLSQVVVQGGRLVMLRQRDGGLLVLPSLQAAARGAGSQEVKPSSATQDGVTAKLAAPNNDVLELVIEDLQLRDSELVYWDASVARPAHRLQLREVQARAGPLVWPKADVPVPLQLQAKLAGGGVGKGAGEGGELRVEGSLSLPPRDGQISVRLRDVDLTSLTPYFQRRGDAPLLRGRLDLDLKATLKSGQLQAPGRVELRGVAWREDGALGGIAGIPRGLVLAALARNGRIELHFELEGRLDDPRFSLNESLAGRFAVGLAKSLGLSVQGVVEGLGGVLRGLLGR